MTLFLYYNIFILGTLQQIKKVTDFKNDFSKSTFDLCKMFHIDSEEITKLDDYFFEYFVRLLKRLRDINFEDVQLHVPEPTPNMC